MLEGNLKISADSSSLFLLSRLVSLFFFVFFLTYGLSLQHPRRSRYDIGSLGDKVKILHSLESIVGINPLRVDLY